MIKPATSAHAETVAVVGSGSIGSAWAIVFATAGIGVRLHDPDPARLEAALALIAQRLVQLGKHALIDESTDAITGRITACRDLTEALDACSYAQECAPESLELKRTLFAQMDRLAAPDAVLASSSSFLPASRFGGELPGRSRMLVVHPGNPPYLLRVVEVVPAPFTASEAVERASGLMTRCGLVPVHLKKEIDGFVFNRLQGAVLHEAYCLVRDGVVSAGDIDLLMRDGLGLRWSLMGPFETSDLNTRGGITAHAERMGPAYLRMGRERGLNDAWTSEMVAAVTAERRAALPLDQWDQRVAWRDETLMALLAWRRKAGIGTATDSAAEQD
jgi:3-hydroxyacyl-CoA dehydrogenase